MSIQIRASTQKRLHAMASRTGKTPEQLANYAIDLLIERDEWLEKAIRRGVESASSQPRLTHEQAWQNFEKRREQIRKKQRKAA